LEEPVCAQLEVLLQVALQWGLLLLLAVADCPVWRAHFSGLVLPYTKTPINEFFSIDKHCHVVSTLWEVWLPKVPAAGIR